MSKNVKASSHANPLKTRNGNDRLGPMSWTQLTEALEKAQQPRMKDKIRNRLAYLKKHHPGLVKVAPEPVAEETVETQE